MQVETLENVSSSGPKAAPRCDTGGAESGPGVRHYEARGVAWSPPLADERQKATRYFGFEEGGAATGSLLCSLVTLSKPRRGGSTTRRTPSRD
jgi:hypothetical protein